MIGRPGVSAEPRTLIVVQSKELSTRPIRPPDRTGERLAIERTIVLFLHIRTDPHDVFASLRYDRESEEVEQGVDVRSQQETVLGDVRVFAAVREDVRRFQYLLCRRTGHRALAPVRGEQ